MIIYMQVGYIYAIHWHSPAHYWTATDARASLVSRPPRYVSGPLDLWDRVFFWLLFYDSSLALYIVVITFFVVCLNTFPILMCMLW